MNPGTDGMQHYDSEGRPVSLEKLCRLEPEWAASQIRWLRVLYGEQSLRCEHCDAEYGGR